MAALRASREGAKDAFDARRRHYSPGVPSSLVRQQGGFLATYLLKLYVTGSSPRAETAVANLRRICEEELRGRYELQIIDVLKEPQLAEDEKILATPTLIKQLPPPLRRVIGDLSDTGKVLLGLEVRPTTAKEPDFKPDMK
jgi:circadian clock protein KaiB